MIMAAVERELRTDGEVT
jgi:hypothetical protein